MDIKVNFSEAVNINKFGYSKTFDIEEYLRYVVPSESPASWPAAALYTQAVAARSYAIAQKKRYGAIGDTTDYQVFNANNQNANTDAAITATSGKVLTYKGAVAEACFSASNGGTQLSSVEAGWNSLPYLIHQSDPWTLKPRDGHCVGLSQWGAYQAATLGKTYEQILAFYYPGTVITSNYGAGGSTPPPPTGGNVGKTGVVVVNSAGLNVRSSPNGTLLSYKLYNGHQITVLEEQSAGGYNWYRVRDEEGRTNGWIRSDFVTLSSGGTNPPINQNVGKTGVVIVNSAGLNVRDSANGNLLSYKLYDGHKITVLEEQFAAGGYTWFRIRDEQGRTNGWVRSDFISLNSGGGSSDPLGGNVGKTGVVAVNSAGLNVRVSPNGAPLSYKLYDGHIIVVLEEQALDGFNWFRVRDEQNRTNGWVRSDFIVLDVGGSGSSGYSTWQDKYGNNTFVESYTYSANVYRYQVDLNKWLSRNYLSTVAADGMYGTGTMSATRSFQTYMYLGMDGFAGLETKAALFNLYG